MFLNDKLNETCISKSPHRKEATHSKNGHMEGRHPLAVAHPLPHTTPWEGHALPRHSFQKLINANLTKRKQQTNPNCRTVKEHLTQYVLLKTVRVMKNKKRFRDCYRSENKRRVRSRGSTGILNWILEQKKDVEKLVKSVSGTELMV